MNEQTQDYIKLKSISNKFNEVADDITKDEVKALIMSSIKDKVDEAIGNLDCFNKIEEIADDWISDNSTSIETLISESIAKKFV